MRAWFSTDGRECPISRATLDPAGDPGPRLGEESRDHQNGLRQRVERAAVRRVLVDNLSGGAICSALSWNSAYLLERHGPFYTAATMAVLPNEEPVDWC
jgi:hypothetical protein